MRHELGRLPQAIAAAQARVASAQTQLDDPDLYARDPDAFDRASKEVVSSQASLAELENRWLELELQREESEAT